MYDNSVKSSFEFIYDKDKSLTGLALMYIQVEKYSFLKNPPSRNPEYDYSTEADGFYHGILTAAKVLRPDVDFYGEYVTPLRNFMQKEAELLEKQLSSAKDLSQKEGE